MDKSYPKAKLIQHNASPAIWVDGKVFPPMTATVTTCRIAFGEDNRSIDTEYYKELGKAGIKIYYIMCNNLDIDKNGVEAFEEEANLILKAVPDAYIMVRLTLVPSKKWIEENPDQVVSYSDNKKIKTTISGESFIFTADGMPSLCSRKWREDMGKTMLQTIEKIRLLPCASRIIGYFLGAGGTSEWYYLNPIENFETGSYGDTSKAFKEEFQSFLNKKYGSDAVEATIPDTESRFYTSRVDYDIAHPGRIRAGQKPPLPPSNGTNHGSFLDIDKYPHTFDFYRAWHEGTANSIIHFAKLIKDNYPDSLVGSFYGSMGGSEIVWGSNGAGVVKILDSEYIDFLANPGVYENRQPGGFTGQRQCPDSYRLRGKMYIVEEDTRTHAENTYFGEMVEMFTIEDTVNVLKRDFGRNICEDLQSWWFDQHVGGGRYKFPEIYRLFKTQQEISNLAYSLDRRKGNEIAFIYDEESVHTVSRQTTDELVQNIRNYEIANIGAPVDSYFHNDMSNPHMPDYKLYVFLNCMYLSNAERKAIKNKLRRNNATALFMYGSGIINPDKEKKLDVANLSELTGIQCSELVDKRSPMFKITDELPEITANLDKGKIYGAFLKERKASVGFIPLAMPRSYLYPVIYADDPDCLIPARFADSSLPAIAIKKLDGYTSVYYGAKHISAELLREFARYAGCHIYEEDGHVLYANDKFITVHASHSGKIRLKFKKTCSPRELYENKYYGKDTTEISFDMLKGDTKMFILNN